MLWNYLKTAKKPILLYGMGDGAEKILDHLLALGITPSGVFASDGFARHNIFRGYEVISYSEAKEKYKDFIALICFGSQRPEVLELFQSMLPECELYAPDVPVYGKNIFDRAFAVENSTRLESVYNSLADDQSRKVFENTVRYKLTGKIQYLFDCQSTVSESYESILKPSDGEIYADLGAYTGDTVAEFTSFCKNYKKIIAVEPDVKSFRKLEKNTSDYENIKLFNIAVSSDHKYLPFSMEGGRQSVLKESGKVIECNSVDNILGPDGATIIKFDVEGAEYDAIKGAENTIKTFKPKLCISAYHRSEDYFLIPELVKSIRDDYKIYMRHFPYVPAWDTCFYFV